MHPHWMHSPAGAARSSESAAFWAVKDAGRDAALSASAPPREDQRSRELPPTHFVLGMFMARRVFSWSAGNVGLTSLVNARHG